MVPWAGLEPASFNLLARDFKSLVYTISPPGRLNLYLNLKLIFLFSTIIL